MHPHSEKVQKERLFKEHDVVVRHREAVIVGRVCLGGRDRAQDGSLTHWVFCHTCGSDQK